jgi:hypothetical protein
MPRVVPALALTAALACAACGSPAPADGVGSSASSAASSPVTSAPSEPTSGAAPATDAGTSGALPTETAQVIALTVTSGEVSGETGRVVAELGSEVRIEVTADVADEVHVHGYDLTVDTVPGRPVTIEFTADIPGVFEVELHGSSLPLARLQVQ